MSDLMNTPLNRSSLHWQFLSTVSALALMGSLCGIGSANAGDEDRPTFWIELGGQAEVITGQGEPFAPHFITSEPDSPAFVPMSPAQAQRPAQFSFGENAKISFQPESSNWVFSAAIRYGRSGDRRAIHQQSPGTKVPTSSILYQLPNYKGSLFIEDYAQYRTLQNENHAILDFQVGRDVGLGAFGAHSKSVFNLGVRIVRFDSKTTADIRARPDLATYGVAPAKYWNKFHLTGESQRSFHGIGPTISWDGSAPVMGDPDDGELAIDWGVNLGVLFGRQRATIKHTTSDDTFKMKYNRYSYIPAYNHATPVPARSRSVTVPNFGGFAGISYRFSRAALSVGYRADIFSGAIDGGIDTAEKSTLNFHGPFATVSIGFGG